jgi:heme o synthase
MLFEPKYDALMTRTRNRPLVRKLITPTSASLFALTTGLSGLTLLYLGTNPTVAALSALNILLYAGIYTPMKRISVLNTWVGAIVGGIPPLMGWAAAAGQSATAEHHAWQDLLFTEDALGGWLLAALLFAWQFPHFNALSHSIRDEYKNAGYRMLAWTNPAMNGRVALRYSLLLFPISAALCWAGIVNNGFLALSTVCNFWISREAYRFWSRGGAGGSARGLFWASIWSLPLLMVGGLVCKKGVWDGVFDLGGSADGHDDEDDRYDEYEEEPDGKEKLALVSGSGSAPAAPMRASSEAS